MLTEAQVARFAAEGFVCGSRILGTAEVAQLQEEIERVLRDAQSVRGP